MATVTERISEIKWPYGGYIKLRDFSVEKFEDYNVLFPEENIPANIVGMVVDYLSRYMLSENKIESFKCSLLGAKDAFSLGIKRAKTDALELLEKITGVNDLSIKAACQIVCFDVWYRNPLAACFSNTFYYNVVPNKKTIQNIRIMINRTLSFWKQYGPVLHMDFTFEGNENNPKNSGYTKTIHAGDGDFLTEDTLWDLKVSKRSPKPKNTLQVLIYWIMAKHSNKEMFEKVDRIGIYNPRLNKCYICNMCNISKEVIVEIERNVIRYPKRKSIIHIMDELYEKNNDLRHRENLDKTNELNQKNLEFDCCTEQNENKEIHIEKDVFEQWLEQKYGGENAITRQCSSAIRKMQVIYEPLGEEKDMFRKKEIVLRLLSTNYFSKWNGKNREIYENAAREYIEFIEMNTNNKT